jgi:hypothetical protein
MCCFVKVNKKKQTNKKQKNQTMTLTFIFTVDLLGNKPFLFDIKRVVQIILPEQISKNIAVFVVVDQYSGGRMRFTVLSKAACRT